MSTKKHTVAVGRDAKTGRMIPAGYGALKGKYVVREGVDLTKPIFEQVVGSIGRKVALKKRSAG
jgi:hypothetical protein